MHNYKSLPFSVNFGQKLHCGNNYWLGLGLYAQLKTDSGVLCNAIFLTCIYSICICMTMTSQNMTDSGSQTDRYVVHGMR